MNGEERIEVRESRKEREDKRRGKREGTVP
jgi:hypothetical protein